MDDALLRRLLALKSHPKYFLKYCTWTRDGNDLQNPIKQFPFHLDYHQALCDDWYSSNLLIVPKSRQMQVTWSMLGMFLWLGLVGTDREVYVRRQTFDDALKLLQDMSFIYEHIPESVWPKEFLPRPKYNKEGGCVIDGEITFPDIGTRFYAISSGRDKMRGRTPTAVLLDEYGFQDDAEMVLQTILPSIRGGAKVSIVSTYPPLFGGDRPAFNRLVDDQL